MRNIEISDELAEELEDMLCEEAPTISSAIEGSLDLLKRLISKVMKVEDEVKRLRKIIEDAPHMPYCDCVSGCGYDCSCWKKGVLV